MFVKVKVEASAKKEEVKKRGEDSYVVSVKEKAERNMANKRVLDIIALIFSVPVSKVRIISGHHNPNKILSIRD